MHQCSQCAHCGAVVDLHDTLRDDHCQECGRQADWNDDQQLLDRLVQQRQAETDQH